MSALCFGPQPAAAQPRIGIEAESNFLAARNPFLLPDHEALSLAVELILRPTAKLSLGPKTNIEGEAELGVCQYHARYGNFLTGHAIATIEHRASERLSVTAAASRRRELPTEATVATTDAAVDPLSIRKSTALRSNVTWNRDARTTLSTDLAWERLKYGGSAVLQDVQGVDLRMNMTRRTDPRTTLGVQLQYTLSRTDGFDDWLSARAIRLTARRLLSPRWRADVSAGAEWASLLDPQGQKRAAPLRFSGSANMCFEPQHLTLCSGASMRTVVSGIGGLQRELNLNFSARKRLSEYSFLTATADFTRTQASGLGFNSSVARASAGYERRMSRRFWLHGRADFLRRSRPAGEHTGAAVLRIGVIFRGAGQ